MVAQIGLQSDSILSINFISWSLLYMLITTNTIIAVRTTSKLPILILITRI